MSYKTCKLGDFYFSSENLEILSKNQKKGRINKCVLYCLQKVKQMLELYMYCSNA